MYAIVWQFRPVSGREAEFERAYGPSGAWAQLFRRGEGYLGTALLRPADGPGGYLTVDRWASREAYEAFRARLAAEYAALDATMEALTESEALVGVFEPVGGARSGTLVPVGSMRQRRESGMAPAIPVVFRSGGGEMPRVMSVEKRIWDVEGFAVRVLHLDGKDVRGDRMGMPQYPYTSPAKNDLSVENWKEGRFRQAYPGFRVEVLDCDGTSTHGNTRLGTVRDTYLDDE